MSYKRLTIRPIHTFSRRSFIRIYQAKKCFIVPSLVIRDRRLYVSLRRSEIPMFLPDLSFRAANKARHRAKSARLTKEYMSHFQE